MYKFERYRQIGLADFNQPLGLKMNPENRWVKKAETIPWDAIEERYAKLFPSKTGMPAKPLRTVQGSLIIQKQLGFSDRELIEEISENLYLQYFIGLPGFQTVPPFVPSLLVEFRKRLNEYILREINEMIIAYNTPDDPTPGGGSQSDADENAGTMILDASCAPQKISFPQDINILNEAREDLEAIKKQLQYIRRDRKYLDEFLKKECEPTPKQAARLTVIDQVYERQKYMYDNRVHSVPDRIVNIRQPYIRPIVRGKAATPVEFGAKFDLSLDEKGMAQIEKMSFDAYNESDVLISAVQHFLERTGHYPERVLADKIYQNRANLQFCKARGIRLSGLALGRPLKNAKTDKKTEYADNADRIAIEQVFALAKQKYVLGLITSKLDQTTRSSIALSVIAMNVDQIYRSFLLIIFDIDLSRFKQHNFMLIFIQNTHKKELVSC